MTQPETTLERVSTIIYDNLALDQHVTPHQELFYTAAAETRAAAEARGNAGLDSLDRAEIVIAIEEIYDISIPDADVATDEWNTAAGIAAYIDRRVAEKG